MLCMIQEHKLHTIQIIIHKIHGIVETAEQYHEINKIYQKVKKENWINEYKIQTSRKNSAYNFQVVETWTTEMFQQVK